MSIRRICDRCGAPATRLVELQASQRTIIVPQASPATSVVAADLEVSIGVQAQPDLCDPCFASGLLEYALIVLPPGALTLAAVKALVARIVALLPLDKADGVAPAPVRG